MTELTHKLEALNAAIDALEGAMQQRLSVLEAQSQGVEGQDIQDIAERVDKTIERVEDALDMLNEAAEDE